MWCEKDRRHAEIGGRRQADVIKSLFSCVVMEQIEQIRARVNDVFFVSCGAVVP